MWVHILPAFVVRIHCVNKVLLLPVKLIICSFIQMDGSDTMIKLLKEVQEITSEVQTTKNLAEGMSLVTDELLQSFSVVLNLFFVSTLESSLSGCMTVFFVNLLMSSLGMICSS